MQFTGELKEKLEKAASREEALNIFKEAGIILTPEELTQISGGEKIPSPTLALDFIFKDY